MVEIPAYLGQRQLQGSSGLNESGLQGLRPASVPQASPGAFQGIAEGLQRAGQAIGSVGERIVAFDRRRQEAEDVAKTEEQTQLFLQQLDTTEEEQRKSTRPEGRRQALLDAGKGLIEDFAAQVGPRRQQRFRADAQRFVTARARGVQDSSFQEFVQQGRAALQASVDSYTQRFMQSRSEVEGGLYLQHIKETLDQGVVSGLVTEPESVRIIEKVDQDSREYAARVALRADPGQAVQDFQALLKGGKGATEALNRAPFTALPKLFDEAQEQLAKRVAQTDHADARARRTLHDEQGRNASRYRETIRDPRAESATLVGLVDQVNADRRAQLIGEEDHASLLGDIQTFLGKKQAEAFQDRDIPSVAKQASLLIELAATPAALEQARAYVTENAASLSSESLSKYLGRIDVRKEKGSYTNRDAYREGKQLILGAAFPGGVVPAAMDKIDAATQTKLSAATDIYAEMMDTIYTREGPERGDARAREEARKLRDLYFPLDDKSTRALPGLPDELRAATTYEEGLGILKGMDIPQALKRQYYLKMKQSLPRQAPANAPAPIGPATKKGEAAK